MNLERLKSATISNFWYFSDFCLQSEASKDKQLKRQNSNVSKSDIAIDVNENPAEDSPPESERKEAVKVEEPVPEVTQKKGSYNIMFLALLILREW